MSVQMPNVEDNLFVYDFRELKRKCKKTGEYTVMRIDHEGMMIDVWDSKERDWVWNKRATHQFKKHFGYNSELNFTQNEKKILLETLQSIKIDSVHGDNKYDQDEIGLIMAKLSLGEELEETYLY